MSDPIFDRQGSHTYRLGDSDLAAGRAFEKIAAAPPPRDVVDDQIRDLHPDRVFKMGLRTPTTPPTPGFTSTDFVDADGNPEGGSAHGVGFAISWQRGPLGRGVGRKDPNGAFVEDVIGACLARIEFYQASRFACPENAAAIDHLVAAIAALRSRTASRESRGVEGTHGT